MFQRFRQTIATAALAFMPELYAMTNRASEVKKSLRHKMQRSYVWRTKAEIDTLRSAIQAAESPLRPDRRALYSIYRETEQNSEVVTQVRVASFTVCRAPFQLVKKGKIDDDIKERFEKAWFDDLLHICVETEFYGHSIVEFDALKTPQGDFKNIYCIPRENIRPEYGDALLTTADAQGVDFRDTKLFPFLLEIGKPFDLGLFKVVSFPAIRMKYSDSDWSLFSEKFGMPIMAIKATTRDKAETDELETMAQNMGSNGYVILDEMDEIQFMNGNTGAAPHAVFYDRVKLAENQIAKLINGQSSTSDEKSHVGSAEVHERILNNFTYGRLRTIQFFINETLIPFMITHGYPLDGYKFQFTELLPKEITEEANPTTSNKGAAAKDKDNAPAPNGSGLQKKKSKPKLTFTSIFESAKLFYDTGCCAAHASIKTMKLNFDLNALMETVIQDIYTERIKKGDLNIELWRENATTLIKGMEKGYGKTILKTEYSDPDKEVLSQLKYNIQVFAAFKNYANINDMIAAMYDENGNIKPFGTFKNAAAQLGKIYNINWLKAEYQTAVGTARMAANWNHIKQDHGNDVLLRYNTVGDSRVRKSHEKLDGVTLPMNNVFWKQYYPPNGWNCRCDVDVIYDEPITEPDVLPNEKEVPPSFRFNAADEGRIFSTEHPYFNSVTNEQKKNITSALNKALAIDFEKEDYIVSQEKFKAHFRFADNYESIGIDEQSGGYLFVHQKHDVLALHNELNAAGILKNKGYRVLLLNEQVKGVRPDALINELIFDLKQMSEADNPHGRIVQHFRKTYKKAKRMVLHISQEANSEAVIEGLKEGFRKYDIEQVILIYKNIVYDLNPELITTFVF